MTPYPILLAPIMRPLPWGGNRLKELSEAEAVEGPVGEAWIMSKRNGAVSKILNGPLAGSDLGEYLNVFPDAVGDAYQGTDFPLLLKLIDAADKLSVQVHPDDAYAKRVEGESGKCEVWYIIDAAPGSEIIAGLADGVDPKEVTSGIPDESLFRKIHPVAGDVVFIPPGLVHSIGAGILLCEIQQNSDLTYRIFDFGRKWNGAPRQLHLHKAADCISNYSNDDIENRRFSIGGRTDPSIICSCEKFTVKKLLSSNSKPLSFEVPDDRFSSLTVVGSESGTELYAGNAVIPLSFGSCVFFPAGTGNIKISGNAVVLISEI